MRNNNDILAAEPAPAPAVRNPLVQISDEFVMPREVASRLIVCHKISNKLRKRCKKAMQAVVISRAPILQEMLVAPLEVPPGDDEFEKGDRVYNLAQVGKTVEIRLSQLVKKLNYSQLCVRLRRIPAKRREVYRVMTDWGVIKLRLDMLNKMRDAIEGEILRRTRP